MMRRHEGGRDFDPLAPLKMLLPTCLQALSEWKVGIFTKDNLPAQRFLGLFEY